MGRAHLSFGMTPSFREYDLWSQKTQILKKSVSYQKKATHAHPSFGITTTNTLRSVFSWRASLALAVLLFMVKVTTNFIVSILRRQVVNVLVLNHDSAHYPITNIFNYCHVSSVCLNVTSSAMLCKKVASTFIKMGYLDILLPEGPANLLNGRSSVKNLFFTSGRLEVSSLVFCKGKVWALSTKKWISSFFHRDQCKLCQKVFTANVI